MTRTKNYLRPRWVFEFVSGMGWFCGFQHLYDLVSIIGMFGILVVCFVLMIGLGIRK